MKVLYTKFDKHKIADLPRVVFPGRIITISTPGETEKAVDFLLSQEILGVDTETRPSFKKGLRYEVSLLQVSTVDTCMLFRLHLTGMTPAILRFLEDKKVPKIGLSWHDDLLQLHRKAAFEAGYFVELQDVAADFGIEDKSLQKLYANLFRKKISKAQRLSNWEATILRDSQKLYAATDAWTCILLYQEFKRLAATKDYKLVEVKDEDQQQNKKVLAEKQNMEESKAIPKGEKVGLGKRNNTSRAVKNNSKRPQKQGTRKRACNDEMKSISMLRVVANRVKAVFSRVREAF